MVSKTNSNQDQTTEAPVHCKPVLDAEWRRKQLTDVDCFDRESVKDMRLGPDYSLVYIHDHGQFEKLSKETPRSEYKLHSPLPHHFTEDDFCYTYKLQHANPLSLADGTLYKTERTRSWDSLIKLAVPTDKLTVFNDNAFDPNLSPEEF